MSTDTDAPCAERMTGNVCLLPIASLRTSYGSLRPGRIAPRADQGSELPLRVAPCPDTGDGEYFEVLDGFKRLQRWREQGATVVPVVIETPAHTVQHKRLMLAVNAPARTITALDEARVVCSLLEEDGLTPTLVARLVGRKPDWIERRKAIGTRLSPSAQERVARGAMGADAGARAHIVAAVRAGRAAREHGKAWPECARVRDARGNLAHCRSRRPQAAAARPAAAVARRAGGRPDAVAQSHPTRGGIASYPASPVRPRGIPDPCGAGTCRAAASAGAAPRRAR